MLYCDHEFVHIIVFDVADKRKEIFNRVSKNVIHSLILGSYIFIEHYQCYSGTFIQVICCR